MKTALFVTIFLTVFFLSLLAFAETTTILTPEGDIIVCTVSESGVVVCL